ncbi:hypothetical protein E2562_021175 [Oryza meyeriana var. granulata]|uniref:Ubiquitin-like protease family profile domain-containing protein n=1 Tax=Oryza meyeriana var. granulata TaxID=110450 RepID=A0A6G1DZ95_9ORYZ|nr:hypothetical protein E2562_021175 [Oryza meyeriana var. granulata]
MASKGTAQSPYIIQSDDESLNGGTKVDNICARLARPQKRVIDAYIQIIKDMESIRPRGVATAFFETEAHCQAWKSNGLQKGTGNKRYREQRAKLAIKFLEHDMVFLPLNRNSNHWYAAVLNGAKEKIQILDPLHMDRTSYEADEGLTNTDTSTTFRTKLASILINSSMNEVIEVQEDIQRLQIEAKAQRKLKEDMKN